MWKIDLQTTAIKDMKALSKQDRAKVLVYMTQKVANYENPTDTGKPLVGGDMVGKWRYRIGDIRVVAIIDKKAHTIFIQNVGRRDSIYGAEEDAFDLTS